MKKSFSVFAMVLVLLFGCGTVQSIIKSSFPYTATLTIPASSTTGTMLTAVSVGTSFDQNFVKNGNNGSHIDNVHMVSAKMTATIPADQNIGDLASVKIFMAKANGDGEVMVASRTDIGTNTGNTLVLDIDNAHSLDELVREKNVRIKMLYVLRNKTNIDVSLRVTLGLTAEAAR